jgi:perosamine synthetase
VEIHIPVASPTLGEAEMAQLAEVIESGWISSGPKVAEFERVIAEYTGAKHAVAVNSGTAALHAALAAKGIGAGDEVIVPSLTFIASANVILYQGATPVLCDNDPLTYNVTADLIRANATDRTRCVIPVEMNGLPIDYDTILPVVEEIGASVIVDSAESLGSAYRDVKIGGQAEIHTLSFFPNKTVTTGEGGMVLIQDDETAERVRMLINQGQEGRYVHTALGFNYRMTEMQAAIGLGQMSRIDWVLSEKERIADRYDVGLAIIPGIEIPVRPGYATAQSWFVYSIRVKNRTVRDYVVKFLAARGIETRTGFPPIHTQPYYKNLLGYAADRLPDSVTSYERKIDIPCWAGLTTEAQDEIVGALMDCASSADSPFGRGAN